MNSTDKVIPNGKWEFDSTVASVFNNMLARSIPQYEIMRNLCFELGQEYVTPNTYILDLGASLGDAINPFVQRFQYQNKYMCVEISPEMLKKLSDRFSSLSEQGIDIDVISMDLRTSFPEIETSVILSILTLQFTPIEYRQDLIQKIYDSLIPKGAFIFVEKVLGTSAEINKLMVKHYYDLKRQNGYTEEQIERKRLSLEGVLVPVTASWNEELLRQAGFRQVDCFWRYLNFSGWVAIK